MQYTTIVEHSEDGLTKILERAERFERESVLQAIVEKNFSTYDIMQMTIDVQEYHAKLRREILAVAKFSNTFNLQFATNNNKCFEVAERFFSMIRSSLSGSKKIYRKFCKTIRKRYPGSNEPMKASVFTHSSIVKGNYSMDIFGEEAYPPEASTLCSELESFFSDLTKIIILCKKVMSQESALREDPTALNKIYSSDYKKYRETHRIFIDTLKGYKISFQSDSISIKKKKQSLQSFLRETFHMITQDEFIKHVVHEEIEKGRKAGLEEDESIYWSEHPEIVPDVRLVIEHFDELEPQGRMDRKTGKYKLSGEIMSRFVRWCMIESGFEGPFIENYFNRHYKGKYITIHANSINTAKNKFTKAGRDPEFEIFVQKVETLLTKYKKISLPELSLAVNY